MLGLLGLRCLEVFIMTAVNPWLDGEYGYAPEVDNIKRGANLEGVESGMTPTQRAAGANMSVDIAAGYYWINQTRYTYAGGNQAVNAAHATLARWDIIYFTAAGIQYTAGTAATYPLMPTLPASSVLIASVYVAAADTSITDSEIRDERVITPGSATGNIDGSRLKAGDVDADRLTDKFMRVLGSSYGLVTRNAASGNGALKTISVTFYRYLKIVAHFYGNQVLGSGAKFALRVNSTEVAYRNPCAGAVDYTTLIVEGVREDGGTGWRFNGITSNGDHFSTAVTMPGAATVSIDVYFTVGTDLGNQMNSDTFIVYGDYA